VLPCLHDVSRWLCVAVEASAWMAMLIGVGTLFVDRDAIGFCMSGFSFLAGWLTLASLDYMGG
jgi:hypothetical protein